MLESGDEGSTSPTNDDEMVPDESVHNERQAIACGFRIGRVFSLNDRSDISLRAPSTSAMSTASNNEHGVYTPQPGFDPFIQLVSNGYNGIKGRKIRRKLEQNILNMIANAEDEDENMS